MEDLFGPYFMGVALLHKCNFNCDHCGYLWMGDTDDHIIKPGYRVTWDQLNTMIDDCKSIEGALWSVLFTGGEPTLWEEGDLKFIDALLACEKAGIRPRFNTNGSYFDDYEQCRDFFNTYADNAKLMLVPFISVDNFHNNYDRETGRAKCLDNVVRVLEEMSPERRALFMIRVVIVVTNDPNSSLPEEMKEYYTSKGIHLGDSPMMPVGKAKNLTDKLPDLESLRRSRPPRDGKRPRRPWKGAVLVGDSYMHSGKPVAKLGHLVDLLSETVEAA